MADALEAAHAQGIIHRDLKPSNVKVRDDGHCQNCWTSVLRKRLTQKLTGPTSNSSTVTSPALTQMGFMLGTPAYMAPEQVRGKVMDGRADIWAFGCLVFEMLAGCRAFPGATNSDTIAKILEREPDWQALPRRRPPACAACSLVASRRIRSAGSTQSRTRGSNGSIARRTREPREACT